MMRLRFLLAISEPLIPLTRVQLPIPPIHEVQTSPRQTSLMESVIQAGESDLGDVAPKSV